MKQCLFAVALATAACGGSTKVPTPPATGDGAGGDVTTEPTGGGGRVGAFPCEPRNIVGDWTTESGSDFESISLADGGGFTTYLHDRLMYSGTWELVDGALSLQSDAYPEVIIDAVRCAPSALIGTAHGGAGDVRWNRVDGTPPAPTE